MNAPSPRRGSGIVRSGTVSGALMGVVAWALVAAAPLAAQDAQRLYEDACDAGDFIACNVLGLMHETGEGVPRDAPRAAELYERACEGGALVGCTNFGLVYASGVGVPRDPARATGLLRVACEGGESLGCERLRAMLSDGGVGAPVERFTKAGRVGANGSGEALAGAIVELPELSVRAISDAEGRVVLPGVPEGLHVLRVDREGHLPLIGQLEVPGSSDFVVLLERSAVENPRAPGRIVGRVLQPGERPLSDVDIEVIGGMRARTLSNQDGRFTLRDLPPGLAEVRFRRLGYAPRTATIVVHPERTVEVSATLVPAPIELEPIQVLVRSTALERTGFYERADRGWGVHFSPHELQIIDAIAVSEIVQWRVPGVRLEYNAQQGVMQVVSRRGQSIMQGDCVLPVFIDGVPSSTPDIDQIPPDHLEGIEVFNGVSTPIEYSAGPNTCGAVMLWTRGGA